MTRSTQGFSLFELVVVICIVAALAVALNRRLHVLRVDAERAAAEHVIGAVRSAVALEMARHVVRGGTEALGGYLDDNPMDRLAEPPGNYLGELAAADPRRIPGGHWYFDRSRKLLIYRVRYGAFLRSELPGPPRLRFKYRLLSADSTPNEKFAVHGKGIRGLTVTAVEPYRWVNPRGTRKKREGRES